MRFGRGWGGGLYEIFQVAFGLVDKLTALVT